VKHIAALSSGTIEDSLVQPARADGRPRRRAADVKAGKLDALIVFPPQLNA
jgi:hypothetical protein